MWYARLLIGSEIWGGDNIWPGTNPGTRPQVPIIPGRWERIVRVLAKLVKLIAYASSVVQSETQAGAVENAIQH